MQAHASTALRVACLRLVGRPRPTRQFGFHHVVDASGLAGSDFGFLLGVWAADLQSSLLHPPMALLRNCSDRFALAEGSCKATAFRQGLLQLSSEFVVFPSAMIVDIFSICCLRFSTAASRLCRVFVGAMTGVRAVRASRTNGEWRVPEAANGLCSHLPESGRRNVLGEFGPRTYNADDFLSPRCSQCSRQRS